jgi:hypothetical protein
MSERPDLFVNKKSSHAEIIEVRIDATMPDITQELLKRSLYEVFGERNAMRRRERIAELWTVDCTFVDNDGEHQGQDALPSPESRSIHRGLFLVRSGRRRPTMVSVACLGDMAHKVNRPRLPVSMSP